MKKTAIVLKLSAILLATGVLSACTTVGIDSHEDWQGKVWRGTIQRQFEDTSGNKMLPSDDIAKKTRFSLEHEQNMRASHVRFYLGGAWGKLVVASVLVPDDIEFDDIKKGALVDFILEPGVSTDYPTYRVNRILRLVCRANDDACRAGEKSSKRLDTIVDATPGDSFQKYGVTYDRRNTPEDIAKYK